MIKLNNIVKDYTIYEKSGMFKKKARTINAVKGVSFDIEEGEIVGLLGLNGAGKSTLIKMMTGILTPTSGTIEVNSYVPYKREDKFLKSIGVVMGNRSSLFYDLPIIDSFEYLMAIYGLDKKATLDYMNPIFEALNIKDLLNIPVRKLSLGQCRKAEVAATFLHQPNVIFMDEPTLGLDVTSSKELIEYIRQLSNRVKTTIIYTSHNLNEVEYCCQRIIFLKDGLKTYDGPTANFGNKKELFKVVLSFKEVPEQRDGLKKMDDLTYYAIIEKKDLNRFIAQFNSANIVDFSTSEPTLEDMVVNYEQ